ncbi:MAG: hypothetical protein ACRDP7_00400, partial [Trebonia sp.]
LAHRVVGQARDAKPMIIEGRELDDLWAAAVKEAGLPYVPSFLARWLPLPAARAAAEGRRGANARGRVRGTGAARAGLAGLGR